MATRGQVNRAIMETLRRMLRRFPDETIGPFVRCAQIGRRDAPPAEKEWYKAALQEAYRVTTRGTDPVGNHDFGHWVSDHLVPNEERDGETDPSRADAVFDAEPGIEP